MRYPRFLGDGYVALSPLRGGGERGGGGGFDELTTVIVCRPETNNGLVLLNTVTVDAEHDFFSVALADGRAVFTYDAASLYLLLPHHSPQRWTWFGFIHDLGCGMGRARFE